MKRISRICCTLATLLMSLGAVTSVNALQLKAVSPNLLPAAGGGHPTWLQDINSIAIQPPSTGGWFSVTIPATGFPVVSRRSFFIIIANPIQWPWVTLMWMSFLP